MDNILKDEYKNIFLNRPFSDEYEILNRNGNITLSQSERLDDLQYKGFKIIQDKNLYCFTSDAVALANFVKVKKDGLLFDIGSGSGVITILASQKNNCRLAFGMEIQKNLFELSRKNAAINGLSDKIKFLNQPVQNCDKIFKQGVFDTVVCNPPYYKSQDSMKNSVKEISLCRHEESLSLSDMGKAASYLLKFGGDFYTVNKINRMEEVFSSLDKFGFSVKELLLVKPKGDKPFDIFLLKARLNGKKGLILKELTVYNEDGGYTSEGKKAYGID